MSMPYAKPVSAAGATPGWGFRGVRCWRTISGETEHRVRNVGFLERGDLLRSQFHGNRCERVIEVVELGGADYRGARSLAFRSQSAASTAEIAVATSPLRPRFTNATPQSFIRRGDLEGRMSGDDRAELALDQLYDRSI